MPTDAQWFSTMTGSRRSWLGFTGEAISEGTLRELVGVAGTAPSDMNLQPWRFVAALGKDKVERVLPAFLGFNQPKLLDAGNVVLVYGDTSAMDNTPAADFYAIGYTSPRDFAIRNASFAAMQFMLACHARGLASRPMIGYDPQVLNTLADVPESWVSVLAIILGIPKDVPQDASPRADPKKLMRML